MRNRMMVLAAALYGAVAFAESAVVRTTGVRQPAAKPSDRQLLLSSAVAAPPDFYQQYLAAADPVIARLPLTVPLGAALEPSEMLYYSGSMASAVFRMRVDRALRAYVERDGVSPAVRRAALSVAGSSVSVHEGALTRMQLRYDLYGDVARFEMTRGRLAAAVYTESTLGGFFPGAPGTRMGMVMWADLGPQRFTRAFLQYRLNESALESGFYQRLTPRMSTELRFRQPFDDSASQNISATLVVHF